MGNFIDLTGQRFFRWVVLKFDCKIKTKGGYEKLKWLCKCDCGNIVSVVGQNLKRGISKSCGCYNSEVLSKRSRIHGESKTRLYNTWIHIRDRCHNCNNARYKDYGGRGIKVCDEWRNSYVNFRNWSLTNGYKENLTIERINNDCDYCPNNVTWIPLYEQAKNTRQNNFITYNGKTQILSEWAIELGVKREILKDRIKRYNWSVERAFTTPVRTRNAV